MKQIKLCVVLMSMYRKGNTPKAYKVKQFSLQLFHQKTGSRRRLTIRLHDPYFWEVAAYMKQVKKCISLTSIAEK